MNHSTVSRRGDNGNPAHPRLKITQFLVNTPGIDFDSVPLLVGRCWLSLFGPTRGKIVRFQASTIRLAGGIPIHDPVERFI
jgi:hypothetical protein